MSSATQHKNDSDPASEQLATKPSEFLVTLSTDTQVKSKRQYAPRRRFDKAYKQRILLAYNACSNATEREARCCVGKDFITHVLQLGEMIRLKVNSTIKGRLQPNLELITLSERLNS